jgi:hypothetical protein
MLVIVGEHIRREDDLDRTVRYLRWTERIGGPYFGVSTGVVLLAGFLMAEGVGTDTEWGYPGWVIAGLVIFGITAVLNFAAFGPWGKRINALYTSNGSKGTELQELIRRYLRLAWIDAALILLAVVIMTLKPFD